MASTKWQGWFSALAMIAALIGSMLYNAYQIGQARASYDSRLTAVEQRTEAQATESKDTATCLQAVSVALGKVETRLAAIDKRLDSLEKNLTDTRTELKADIKEVRELVQKHIEKP